MLPPQSVGEIAASGSCVGCGACVLVSSDPRAAMVDSEDAPVPNEFCNTPETTLKKICPALSLSYPDLYRHTYGPDAKMSSLGEVITTRLGRRTESELLPAVASGGILTAVLEHLLTTGRITCAVVARPRRDDPRRGEPYIARTITEVQKSAGSIYTPFSVLDALRYLDSTDVAAVVLLPDQSAALRGLQSIGNNAAMQVQFVLGPYTGTALKPAVVSSFLRKRSLLSPQRISSVKWRAGAWPGNLEVTTNKGRVFTAPKFHYNYLTPFYLSATSLYSCDFTNEFADLASGDAWRRDFEAGALATSVFVTRSTKMELIIQEMVDQRRITATIVDSNKATEMHAHMFEFKKRGGSIRRSLRRRMGLWAPLNHYRIHPVEFRRIAIEIIITLTIGFCQSKVGRLALFLVPERLMGPSFDVARRVWRFASKPSKRRGLAELQFVEVEVESDRRTT